VLISDEPYRALVFDDVVPPEVPPLVTRSIVATSWSKSLAIPGERIGYLAFSPRMPEAAELFEACTFTTRVLGFVNAPALWQWVVAEVGDQLIDIAPYREKRDLICSAVSTRRGAWPTARSHSLRGTPGSWRTPGTCSVTSRRIPTGSMPSAARSITARRWRSPSPGECARSSPTATSASASSTARRASLTAPESIS
jgi:hypothetical protein